MTPARLRLPAAGLALAALAGSALAHAPHDVVVKLSLSPSFATDGTVFAQFNFTFSTFFGISNDRGRSWTMRSLPMLQQLVSDLEPSPDYANDGTWFAGTRADGVHVTTDYGETWAPSNSGLTTLTVEDVAVSPTFATDDTLIAGGSAGCFRSTDRGATWVPSSTGMVPARADVVAYAPDDPSVVFAGTQTLFRSNDGGVNWSPLATFSNTIAALTVSPGFSTDGTLAVSFGLTGGGVEVSTDGGASWSMPTTGLTDIDVNAIAYADDGTLFAATRTAGVFYQTSPTGSWTLSADGLVTLTGMTTDHWRVLAVSPDYSTDGTVFVGAFEGLFRTDDRDGTWQEMDVYGTSIVKDFEFSPDYANDGAMYVGVYGGGLMGYELDPALPRPGAPSPYAIPSLHAGRWSERSDAFNRLWSSALALSPDFANDGTLFYSYTNLYSSTDRGLTFNQLPLPLAAKLVRKISLSPAFATDRTMMVGAENGQGTYLSNDAGASWTTITAGLPAGLHATRHIEFSPNFTSDQTIYMGVTMEIPPTPGTGIYRSTDGGLSWTILPGYGITDQVTALELSPTYPTDGVLFLGTTRNGILRSGDFGGTFQPVAGLPTTHRVSVNEIAVSPAFATDGTVFACTMGDGAFRSTDGGLTWALSGDGGSLQAPWGIAVSPEFATDGTVVLQSYDWLWNSTDGGDTWSRMPIDLRIDEDEPQNVIESGAWTTVADPSSLGQSYSTSSSAGDTITFEFLGDSITWFAHRTPSSGLVDVSIDGGPPTTVDLYASARESSVPVYARDFGASGWHTLEVTVLGLSGPSSSGVDVEYDGVGYEYHDPALASFYGEGLAGTGGRIPTALPCCPLTPGTTPTIEVVGARGGAVGALIVAATPVRFPVFGGLVLVDKYVQVDFHVLSGALGQIGGGTASVPVPVPADPTLSGLLVFAQAGQLDPQAIQGVSLSRGVRLPIP